MEEYGPDNDLVFSSTAFGSGAVDKTQQIAEILKELFKTMTLTTRNEDTQIILSGYYSRAEMDQILQNYAKLVDLQSKVRDLLVDFLNDPTYVGKFASKSDLDSLNESVKNYSNIIDTLQGNQTAIQSSWNDYKLQMNNITSQQTSNINALSNLIDSIRSQVVSLDSSVQNLQSIMNTLSLVDFAKLIPDIEELKANFSNIGDLTKLKTNDKSTIVNSINELFQYANDGKSKISAAIVGKGVDASPKDSFQTLADKINSIQVGGGSSDRTLKERTAIIDGAETIVPANYTLSLATNNSGIFIPTSLNAICANGCDLCYGPVSYVVDGVEHSTSEYNDYDIIEFNESLSFKTGDLVFSESGNSTCNYCGESNPVIQLSGILVLN